MQLKKLSVALFVLSIAGASLLTSCKKSSSSASDCTALTNAVGTASTNYGTNPSSANCTAYKTALNNYINSSCITAAEKTQAQTALSLLNSFCQ